MELRHWMASFRALHEQVKQGQLSGEELKAYQLLRDELARTIVAAQGLTLQEGQVPRKHMRVARGLQIDLDLSQGRVRFMTMNISAGGFGCLMPRDPGKGGPGVGFSLRLPDSSEPLIGRARVVDVQPRPGNVLVSFAFVDLSSEAQERLQLLIFDLLLAQLFGAKL